MSQQTLNNEGQPVKVLWFGDLVTPSGFGRIGNAVTSRLAQRGWHMIGASVLWDGYPPSSLPFYVRPLAGQNVWEKVTQLVMENPPDVIVACQDFPYAQTLFHACPIDWSVVKLIIVTPVDGTPVHPDWLDMVDLADATMVISKFGVEGMRLAEKSVGLLHPGVDTNEFYPANEGEVVALRESVGIDKDAFVMGMFAMNQGRKAISATIVAFKEFALDKPGALLYLDMDAQSPAGWDIPKLLQQIGLDPARVKFRQDITPTVPGLRERYLLCDVNSVVSHREGFGLPLLEAQACKIVAMALDWCSGGEICGDGKGMLIRRLDYMEHGTWGGARDAFPDAKNWVGQLTTLYEKPDERVAIAARGYEWAIQHTWDNAANAFEQVLQQVAEQQRKERAYEPRTDVTAIQLPSPGLSDIAGPAHSERDRAVLQPLIESPDLPRNGDSVGGLEPGGSAGAGRQFAGVRPSPPPADAGSETRAE